MRQYTATFAYILSNVSIKFARNNCNRDKVKQRHKLTRLSLSRRHNIREQFVACVTLTLTRRPWTEDSEDVSAYQNALAISRLSEVLWVLSSAVHKNERVSRLTYLRTFAVAGARIWNSFPFFLRSADLSTERFKRALKTFLFVWDHGATVTFSRKARRI